MIRPEVELREYDPSWSEEFERIAGEVRRALEGVAVAVHHIGSTAIPGVTVAKPVIDVLVEASSLHEVDQAEDRLRRQGFEARSEYGIPGRRYFVRPAGHGRPGAHIHIFEAGYPEVGRHIRFRDHLREHPDEARAYGELKKRLARSHEFDRKSYQAGKAEFIARIDELAARFHPEAM